MKNYSRYFMMLGLLGCLGANLSWNPEMFLVSREDYKTLGLPQQEMQFASRAQAAPEERSEVAAANSTGEVDLSQFDSSMAGVKMEYTVLDLNGNKSVRYTLQGNACADCWKLQKPVIPEEYFKDMKLLRQALAEAAIDKVKEGRATPGTEVARSEAKPKPNETRRTPAPITSKCDEDETADQIRCEKDELQTIMDNCSSSSEDDEVVGTRRRQMREQRGSRREACTRKAQAYYKKYLKKSLKEGLSAGVNSDEYQAAIETRDALLEEMPKKFDNTIKKDLVSTTAQGVVARARDRFNVVLRMSNDQTTATNAAKTYILNETYGPSGMSLCQALSGENCLAAMSNPMRRSVLESNNSNFRIFSENFETRLQQIATYKGNSLPFEQVLNGEFADGVPQMNAVATDIYNARTTGLRQNAQPLPGTGQGPMQFQNGLPAPSGQVWIPSRMGQNGQPVIQGVIAPMVPGQTMNGSPFANQNGTYNPMAPVGPNQMGPRMGPGMQPGMQPMPSGGYPLSPAQRQGRM